MSRKMKLSVYAWVLAGLVRTSTHVEAFVSSNMRNYGNIHTQALKGSKEDNENDKEEPWDANVDYDKEWPQDQAPPDPSTAWDALPNMPAAPRLGIGVSLEPLNAEQAEQLKREAQQIINSRIDKGIEDIEKLRKNMAKEMDQSRKIMQVTSELEAKRKSEDLMQKIDRMTGSFLESTKETRASTKMAAAASKAMEGTNQGIEMGTWGMLSGRTVIASGSGTLLGSVDNAMQQQSKSSSRETSDASPISVAAPVENRIIIIADTKQVFCKIRMCILYS